MTNKLEELKKKTEEAKVACDTAYAAALAADAAYAAYAATLDAARAACDKELNKNNKQNEQ